MAAADAVPEAGAGLDDEKGGGGQPQGRPSLRSTRVKVLVMLSNHPLHFDGGGTMTVCWITKRRYTHPPVAFMNSPLPRLTGQERGSPNQLWTMKGSVHSSAVSTIPKLHNPLKGSAS